MNVAGELVSIGAPRVIAVIASVGLLASVATATGPTQQTAPVFAPITHSVNSIVQVYGENNAGVIQGWGTGSIIGRTTDMSDPMNPVGWLCVLTANHVVEKTPRQTISFGDKAMFPGANGRFGFNGSWVMTHPSLDIALVAVPYGAPDFFFDNLTLLTTVANDPDDLVNNNAKFTQFGYGLTGRFAQGGMNTLDADDPDAPTVFGNAYKRFQNNRIERHRNNLQTENRINPYSGVDFDFDKLPAAGPADAFFNAEGLSYAGDSGGPYMTTDSFFTFTSAFVRPDDADGTVVPDWAGGLMEIYTNSIIAVHTYGNSNINIGGFSAYGSIGGGIPITADLKFWIDSHCMLVPAPGSVSILVTIGVLAIRRRR